MHAKATASVTGAPTRADSAGTKRAPSSRGTVTGMMPNPVCNTLNPLPYCRNEALM